MANKWIVQPEDNNKRLLSFIKERIEEKTTTIRFAIEHQGCRVNKKVERFCSRRLHPGEEVEFSLEQKPSATLKKEAILFEDDHLLIYSKPARISSEDLACNFKLELVHRLDRDTTGILILAKNPEIKEEIEKLFKARKIQKSYLAIVHGKSPHKKKTLQHNLILAKRLPGKVLWKVAPKGAIAITELVTLQGNEEFSYLRLHPKTGRTHQLRVQLSHIGLPIVGDVDYGNKTAWDKRTMLHASSITFLHPHTSQEITIECPLPRDFQRKIEELFSY